MAVEVIKWRSDDGQLYDTKSEAEIADANVNAAAELEALLHDCGCNRRSSMEDIISALCSEAGQAADILAKLNIAQMPV